MTLRCLNYMCEMSWWDGGIQGSLEKLLFGGIYFLKTNRHTTVSLQEMLRNHLKISHRLIIRLPRQKDNITASCFYDSDFYPEGELKLFQMSQQFPFLSLSFSLVPSVSPALSVSPSRSASLTASPTVLITTSTKYPAENTSSLIRDWSIFSIRRHCFLGDAGLPNDNHYRVSD